MKATAIAARFMIILRGIDQPAARLEQVGRTKRLDVPIAERDVGAAGVLAPAAVERIARRSNAIRVTIQSAETIECVPQHQSTSVLA